MDNLQASVQTAIIEAEDIPEHLLLRTYILQPIREDHVSSKTPSTRTVGAPV